MKETGVCTATIFIRTFGTLLLAKNSDVKGSPILNRSDRYAVAIKKDGIIIGHIPRKIS